MHAWRCLIDTLHPMGHFFLRPGSQVGPWRVVEPAGGGVNGAVYRVERVGHEHTGPFALKMARSPEDRRFEREGHLLSIIRHPHVPLLHDRGVWSVPGGPSFPFLVMEFIQGEPLYSWAEIQLRPRALLLQLLAQAARALEATHAAGGLHRDFKGGNILVREQNSEAVLMDFGAGYYRGASILTRQLPPPGTPVYQSPESQLFEFRHLYHPMVRYEAQPADDVYALGMTAYRLLSGSYPPPVREVEALPQGGHRLVHRPLVLPERWAAVHPELAALLHQLLSTDPAARGTAGEVAQALENAAENARRQQPEPRPAPAPRTPVTTAPQAPSLVPAEPSPEVHASPVSPAPSLEGPPSSGPSPLRSLRGRVRGLAAAAAVLSAVLGWSQLPSRIKRLTDAAHQTQERGSAEAGTAQLADSSLPISPQEASPEPTTRPGFALEFPKTPLPGQSRSPCVKPTVEINGGCWVGPTEEAPPCGARSYLWKNSCYKPILDLPPPATSDPH